MLPNLYWTTRPHRWSRERRQNYSLDIQEAYEFTSWWSYDSGQSWATKAPTLLYFQTTWLQPWKTLRSSRKSSKKTWLQAVWHRCTSPAARSSALYWAWSQNMTGAGEESITSHILVASRWTTTFRMALARWVIHSSRKFCSWSSTRAGTLLLWRETWKMHSGTSQWPPNIAGC